MTRDMAAPDPSELREPFRPQGLAVLAALAAIGAVPYGGWVAWALAVPWCLLVVRGTMADRPLDPRPLIEATPDLLPLWGRGLASTGFVLLPYAALMAARETADSFPDSEMARSIAGTASVLGGLLTFLGLVVYPALLGLAATEIDLHFLVSPAAIGRVARRASFALVTSFAGLFLFGLLSALLLSPLPPLVRGILGRFLLVGLLVLEVRLVGLALRVKPR